MNKENKDKSSDRVIISNIINPIYLKELDDFIKNLETKGKINKI